MGDTQTTRQVVENRQFSWKSFWPAAPLCVDLCPMRLDLRRNGSLVRHRTLLGHFRSFDEPGKIADNRTAATPLCKINELD